MGPLFYTDAPDVAVDITNRCNLHCRHCYNCSGEEPVLELAFDKLTSLFDELQDLGQGRLRISGGEPTLHPEFDAIVREATRRGMAVLISTNGQFSADVRRCLTGLEIAGYSVSLDGMRPANDRIRGGGAFDAAVRSIRFLKGVCDDVFIAVHLFRSNLADVQPLIETAQELGVGIKFSPLRPLGRARRHMRDEIPGSVEYRQAVETIERLRPGSSVPIKTDFDVLSPRTTRPTQPPAARAACPAGRSRLNVSYDGRIYPCAFLATPEREFAVGRLGDAPLIRIWRQSPVLKQFRSIQKGDRCRTCTAYGHECLGGCVAMAYFSTGHLDGDDPVCFVQSKPAAPSAHPSRKLARPTLNPAEDADFRRLFCAVRDLPAYTTNQRAEYLRCFSDEDEWPLRDDRPEPGPNHLRERINSRTAAPPQTVGPNIPKLTLMAHIAGWRDRCQGKVGMVSGCFDLLHLGHVRGMRFAHDFLAEHGGGALWAFTMRDDDVRSKKGTDRPIMNLRERLTMMAAVRFVDHVAVLSQPNCLAAIEALRPDYFFKSPTDRTRAVLLKEMKVVESLGGQVVLFPEDEPPLTSTTRIIEDIRARSVGLHDGS